MKRRLFAFVAAFAVLIVSAFSQNADETRKRAVEKFPELAKSGSEFNKVFLALHDEAKRSNPALLADPNWPMILAERVSFRIRKVRLPKVDVVAQTKPGRSFVIKNGTVSVGGKVIRSVQIEDRKVTIVYFNTMGTSVQPKFEFRVLNAYGVEVTHFRDEWTISSISPREERREEPPFVSSSGINSLLEFSAIEFPADWNAPLYLVIGGDEP